MSKETIAFNDFKNAISKKEFEAVFNLCKMQYNRYRGIVQRREKFIKNTTEKFNQAQEGVDNPTVKRGMQKIIDTLMEMADKELLKSVGDELKDIHDITEFLIRFSEHGEYEHIDISFINDIKTK